MNTSEAAFEEMRVSLIQRITDLLDYLASSDLDQTQEELMDSELQRIYPDLARITNEMRRVSSFGATRGIYCTEE